MIGMGGGLFEDVVRGAVALDEIPVVADAEAGAVRYRVADPDGIAVNDRSRTAAARPAATLTRSPRACTISLVVPQHRCKIAGGVVKVIADSLSEFLPPVSRRSASVMGALIFHAFITALGVFGERMTLG